MNNSNRRQPAKVENEFDIETVLFKKIDIPQPTESKVADNEKVKWGAADNYPDFLLDLYNDSSIHGGYVNNKVSYIIGDGLKIKGKDGDINDIKVNNTDTIYEFVRKLILDFELFKSISVEVQYNAANEPIYYNHSPVQNTRTNRLKDKYWYSQDWKNSKNVIQYERFTPFATTSESRMFYYDGYAPTKNTVYPIPDYSRAIKSIMTDIAISDFNHNQIKSHFSVSSMINYFTGEPKPDAKRRMLDSLRDFYSGESGNRIMVSFNNRDGQAPSVTSLTSGDWANAYNELQKNVDAKIDKAHNITSPLLFGNKTEGQLGGSTELEVAYEIFSNTYIRDRRNDLLNALNQLFRGSDIITGELEFIDKPLFAARTSDELKEKILTINELRKEAGMPPIPGGDRLLSEATPQPSFSLIEASDKKKDDAEGKSITRILSEEDFETVAHLGSNKDDFEILHGFSLLNFDTQSDIAKYIIENDITQLTVEQLVEVLDKDGNIQTTQTELSKILQSLQKSGVIKIESNPNNTISIKPPVEGQLPDSKDIEVVYDYVKKPSVSGSELLTTSRGFCRKLCNANKYYTREEIQSMSAIFGYDVYTHTGGWYYNPDTDTTTNSCRHMWQRVAVKRK